MSYGRNPHYIYSDGEYLYLDEYKVAEKSINAFLYKILFSNRREELKQRLINGKKEWLNIDQSEKITLQEYLNRQEDDLLKDLMRI